MATYDVVVYGNGIQAVFAACKAAAEAPSKTIALIVPDTSEELGGIVTIGGQNYWDTKSYTTGDNYPYATKGSFYYYHQSALGVQDDEDQDIYTGVGYATEALERRLKMSVNGYSNITVYYKKDICNYTTASSPYRITSVTIRGLTRNETTGYISWDEVSTQETLNATVFIDASEEGRLARKVNSAVTVGRYDWPTSELAHNGNSMAGENTVGRQQAATLMFKMKGLNPENTKEYSEDNVRAGEMMYEPYPGLEPEPRPEPDSDSDSDNGNEGIFIADYVAQLYGGKKAATENSTIINFNDTYGNRYLLKTLNVARNGYGSEEWWVNGLLIFGVDGRAHERDKGTSFYPTDMISGDWNTDEAWYEAREFLNQAGTNGLLAAIRQFDGFEEAEFVYDEDDNVVVGECLYLRETVHMALDSSNRTHGSETNYAITPAESRGAGKTSTTGQDQGNYASRIGLAYYQSDIHPYYLDHVRDEDGVYMFGPDGYDLIRSDIEDPDAPVYIPFSVMTTNYVSNLLLAGYAVSVSSYAWGEVRVAPNLCVIGDAAGVTAAYCVNNNLTPLQVGENAGHLLTIRMRLEANNARLEKSGF